MSQPDLACDLNALDTTQRARYGELTAQLERAATSFEELSDGYAIQFPSGPDLFLALAEFITLEHRCCPFLNLTLEQQAGKRHMTMRVTGPGGVKEFLRAEFLAI